MSSITNQVTQSLALAARWLEENSELSYTQAFSYLDSGSFFAFSQLWPNTSLGFGGFAGQAFTTAVTIIFFFESDEGCDDALVVIGGRVAYRVADANNSKQFMLDVANHKVAGFEENQRNNPYAQEAPDDSRESSGEAEV